MPKNSIIRFLLILKSKLCVQTISKLVLYNQLGDNIMKKIMLVFIVLIITFILQITTLESEEYTTMKKILFILLLSIAIIVSGSFYMLYSPAPAIATLSDNIVFNEEYFTARLINEGISVFQVNEFTLTEEELNGFIQYKLSSDQKLFENPYNLHLEHINIELLENQFQLDLYAKFRDFPFRTRTTLIPEFSDSSFSFTIQYFVLSKIKIPNQIIETQFNRKNIDSTLGLPFSIPEAITIKEVHFNSDEVTVVYKVNNAAFIDKLIKSFLCSNN